MQDLSPRPGGPCSQDEVDAGSGTGSTEKSLPLRTDRALGTELYPFFQKINLY